MKLSKGKIILVVIVGLLVWAAVKNLGRTKTINEKIVKTVELVNDGKINPALDGKLVLVTGKVSFDEGVKLPELENTINTFKVERTVKEYIRYEKDGENHYDWEERTAPKSYAYNVLDKIFTESVTVPAKVGEFSLDKKGLSLVKAGKNYRDPEFVGDKNYPGDYLTWNGMDYTDPRHKDNEYVGDVSVSYRIFDAENIEYISILAKQKGDSFVPYTLTEGKVTEDVYKVFSKKIDSIDALKGEFDTQYESSKKGKIVFIVIVAVLIILLIISDKKGSEKKAAAAKAEGASPKQTINPESEVITNTSVEPMAEELNDEPVDKEEDDENI